MPTTEDQISYLQRRIQDINDRYVNQYPQWTVTDLISIKFLLSELTALKEILQSYRQILAKELEK